MCTCWGVILFDLWPLKIAVVFAGMSSLQVCCFLQSQIFTAVTVKSGPVWKPVIRMQRRYNVSCCKIKFHLPIPTLLFPSQITWFQQEFYQALLYSPRQVIIVCCRMGSWLLIVTRQGLTDTNPAVLLLTSKHLWSIFQDWHQFTSLFTDTSEKVLGVSKRLLHASWYNPVTSPTPSP